MYGPSVHPELPQVLADSRYGWEADKNAADRNRRSIYVLAKRNMRLPLFEAFDQPDMLNSCPRRTATTTAPQALELLNSEMTEQLARAVERQAAGRMRRTTKPNWFAKRMPKLTAARPTEPRK